MKIPECDHDFEICEVFNSGGYNFTEITPRCSNERFHPYYCKKCGMLILKRVVDNEWGTDNFLWEDMSNEKDTNII